MNITMTDTVNNKKKSNTGMFLSILWTSITTSFLYYAFATAMPAVIQELSVSASKGHWLNSSYSLAMGMTILFNAYLSKRVPTKKLYLCAVITILAGSSFSVLTKSFWGLLVGRMIQALGNGITLALGQQVLLEMYPSEKRGYIIGWYGFSISCTQAVAPFLSGIMTDLVNWRMILWIGEGLMTVSLILNLLLFRDVLQISKRPVLQFHCLKNPSFKKGILLNGLLFAIMLGGTTGLPVYLQNEMGLSATGSGLVLLPGALFIAFLSPVAGKMFDRFGISTLGKWGIFTLLFSMIGMTGMLVWRIPNSYILSVLFLIRGIAIGLVMMPMTTWGLSQLKKEEASVGNSILTGLRTIGGAIGSSIAGMNGLGASYMILTLFAGIMAWSFLGISKDRRG